MENLTHDLIIEPAAPGLQGYLVSLPFGLPEKSIRQALKLLEPLVQRQIRGEGVVRIQATGSTPEAVLQDLANQLKLM